MFYFALDFSVIFIKSLKLHGRHGITAELPDLGIHAGHIPGLYQGKN